MRKTIMILSIVLAVLFLGIAVYYFVTPASSLPSLVPGHIAGSSKIHIKHGLAGIILAIAFGILAWFYSKKTT